MKNVVQLKLFGFKWKFEKNKIICDRTQYYKDKVLSTADGKLDSTECIEYVLHSMYWAWIFKWEWECRTTFTDGTRHRILFRFRIFWVTFRNIRFVLYIFAWYLFSLRIVSTNHTNGDLGVIFKSLTFHFYDRRVYQERVNTSNNIHNNRQKQIVK